LSGHYEPGQLLPPENELARLYGVSRVTIRNAMVSLDRERLIEKRQGIGTFVARRIPSSLHAPVSDLLAHIADVVRTTAIRLIEYEFVYAPPNVRAIFGCDANARFQRAVRIRSAGTKPIFHVTTFLPESIARSFKREDLKKTAIYELLARAGVKLHSGSQIVSAQLADPKVAPLLNVPVGAPLLQIRRQHFDSHGKVVEYFEMLASPAVFELHMAIDAQELQPTEPPSST
jgi:GntR family transcriptional regulator